MACGSCLGCPTYYTQNRGRHESRLMLRIPPGINSSRIGHAHKRMRGAPITVVAARMANNITKVDFPLVPLSARERTQHVWAFIGWNVLCATHAMTPMSSPSCRVLNSLLCSLPSICRPSIECARGWAWKTRPNRRQRKVGWTRHLTRWSPSLMTNVLRIDGASIDPGMPAGAFEPKKATLP